MNNKPVSFDKAAPVQGFSLNIIGELLSTISKVTHILDSSATSGSALAKVREVLSNPLVMWLEQVAGIMYPQLAPELRILAILSHANVNWTMIVQEGLNIVAKPVPPLAVDGMIGPKTIKAIMDFQAKHGLPVNGFIADAEAAILQQALSALNG